MKYKVLSIIPSYNIGNTPAKINRLTGELFINANIWDNLTEKEKNFILLHEEGHYQMQTTNENEADLYAFLNYAGTEPESLKNTIRILESTLDLRQKRNQQRFNFLAKKILEYDYKKYKNLNAKILLEMNNKLNKPTEELIQKELVNYLKKHGINSLSELPLLEKEKIMIDFLKTPEMQYLMLARIKKMGAKSNFSNWELFDRERREDRREAREDRREEREQSGENALDRVNEIYQNFVIPAASPVISAVATGFGLPIPPAVTNTVLNAVNPLSVAQSVRDSKETREGGNKNDQKPIMGGLPPANLSNPGNRPANNNQSAAPPNLENMQNISENLTADAEAQAKKKKILIFGGIGAGVIIIGVVVLVLVLKRKR